MVKPAPSVERATRLLDFLATRPFESFTLSELAAAIEVNPASTLAILQALTQAGYVTRHAVQKTYVLGAALLALGDGARAQHRIIDHAHAEIALIADEAQAECSVGVIAGDDILIVAIAGRPAVDIADVRVGERVPFRPPWGAVQIAFSDTTEQERWIARAGSSTGVADKLRRALATIRDRGYSVSRESDARIKWGSAMRHVVDNPADRLSEADMDVLLEELAGGLIDDLDAGEPVNTISVPVFAPTGRVAMQLSLQGFRPDLPAAQVRALADRMRAGAQAIAKRSTAANPAGAR